MSLANFLSNVFSGNAVELEKRWPIDWSVMDEGEALLLCQEAAESERLEFPGEAPAYDEALALWAAKKLYAIAQLYLNRDLDTEAALEALVQDAPETNDAAVAFFSADICLRFVPSIYKLGIRLASEDPYLKVLADFMNPWPYSAIGMPPPVSIDSLPEVPKVLVKPYTDRCFQRKDYERLKHASVQPYAIELLRIHPDFAQTLPNSLFPDNSE